MRKKTIKESTYYSYLYRIKHELFPYIEDKTLEELEQYNYEIMIKELGQDLELKTVFDILIVLKSILEYSINKYDLKLNIKSIKAPKKTIWELCALKWKNINLDKKELYVRETLQRAYDTEKKKTVVIIDKPKSQSSIRNIPISTKLYNILKKIKSEHNDEEYFLTGKVEKFVEPRNYQRTFKSILESSKIKTDYKFHILRHSFATECIKVGMDIKTLSEILGHSDIEITLKIYVHSSYEMKKKYLEKL